MSDAHGEATMVFIEINDFDSITRTYSGKELIEYLDNMYNAFDQLCEQHGLQKIETIGKTFVACSGLKLAEAKVDQRILSSHHSVRAVDFSLSIRNCVMG